jgi:ADP-ribose pyrophosphatase
LNNVRAASGSESPKPWKKTGSRPAGKFRIFNVRADRKISPRTRREHEFFIIECIDWVNVIALTPEREIVLVRQFRHGSETIELEVPGGVMERSDRSPLKTGRRELREETGYAGGRARIIGRVYPNPAIMNNLCYTVLIENCRQVHPVKFDQMEDLVTTRLSFSKLKQLVSKGTIRHSLVTTALYHFELWQQKARNGGNKKRGKAK